MTARAPRTRVKFCGSPSALPNRIRVLRPSWTRRIVAASSCRIERSVISPFSRIASGCVSSAIRNGRQSANSG